MSYLGPGAIAPPFSLPRLGGGTIQLEEVLQRGTAWLFFAKSSCPTCKVLAPFVERFHRHAAGKAGSIVVVMEDAPEDAANFAATHGWTLPVAVETSPWAVSQAYGLFTVPSNFVINAGGLVTKAGSGFFRSELNETARELLAGSLNLNYELVRAEDGAPEFKPG